MKSNMQCSRAVQNICTLLHHTEHKQENLLAAVSLTTGSVEVCLGGTAGVCVCLPSCWCSRFQGHSEQSAQSIMDGETFLHVASDKLGGEVTRERVGTAGSYRLTDRHPHTHTQGHTATDVHTRTRTRAGS